MRPFQIKMHFNLAIWLPHRFNPTTTDCLLQVKDLIAVQQGFVAVMSCPDLIKERYSQFCSVGSKELPFG